ncbi:MAG: S41 family peptidase [Gemmatimonadales bacterium]|jgi:carboxyl-terminal processing protease
MIRGIGGSHSWLVLLGVAAAALAGCAKGPDRVQETPIESELAMETFETAWRIVYETHFDTTFNGVDWLALHEELRPQVDTVTTQRQLRAILEDMVGRLEQTHFAIIPQEAVDTLDPFQRDVSNEVGDIGLDARLVGEQLIVTLVDEDGSAAAAGVEPGWIIVYVGDDTVSALLEEEREIKSRYNLGFRVWQRVEWRLGGAPGEVRTVGFVDGSEAQVERDIVLLPDASEPVKFGNLPTFFSRFDSYEGVSEEHDVEVGVIWFNFWMVPLARHIDRAVDEYRGLDGIVIDLRGNRGGVGAMVSGVAGHFLDERISLGTLKTRQTALEMRANPRRVSTRGERVSPYAGPVAILIDEVSGSASEMFAGGMQSVGRVRVFGATSLGGVLPASMDRLPNGDVLYHAFGDFITPDGVRLEGRGVVPDEPVALTREGLLSGRDAPLEAAMSWIAAERPAEAVGAQR